MRAFSMSLCLVGSLTVLGSLTVMGSLPAQGLVMQTVTSATPPQARYRHAFLHEPALDSFILFGGRNDTIELNDTWRWNSTNGWQQQAPLTRPIASSVLCSFRRAGSTDLFVYLDRDRGALWRWNGTDWQRNVTSGALPPAAQHWVGTAWDAERQVLVHVQANSSSGAWAYTVHELRAGNIWSQRSFTTSPGVREFAACGGLPGNGVVFHGGIDATQVGPPAHATSTWSWNGINWQQLAAVGPTNQHRHAMSWHAARQRMTMYTNNGELHEWNPAASSWQQQASGATTHVWVPLAYDPIDEGFLVFGSGYSQPATRPFNTIRSATPALATQYGQGCLGSRGLLTLEVGDDERPWLGDTWNPVLGNALPFAGVFWIYGHDTVSWSGIPVPVDLSVFGFTGCFALHSANDMVFRTADVSGQDRPQIPVPTDLVLLNFRFYVQAAAIDASANSGGGVVSNGVEAVLGLR